MMAGIHTRYRFSLGALLQDLLPVPEAADRPVTGLCADSREVQPGDLFIARRGLRVDGADYIDAALERGAVAALWEPQPGVTAVPVAWRHPASGTPAPVLAMPDLAARLGEIADRFYANPSRALTIAGITGTNGKTSVSHFLAHALSGEAPWGVIGTLGTGLAGELTPATHTTPDVIRLHRALAELRESGAAGVAMEVSSHALDQNRVDRVRFDFAVFTNLSRDHLDYHGDMASYAAAKRRLFQWPGLRGAVINVDDPAGREIAAGLPASLPVLRYGLEPAHEPDLLARRVALTPGGLRAEVVTPRGEGLLTAPLLGRFNVANLLATLGVLLLQELPLETALARLAAVPPVPGRMERFGGAGRPQVVVDYAHTPDALAQVLAALREHRPGRLICVFGCGGDRDRGKRPLMGEVAERLADRVIVTDDNPRSEDPALIRGEILAGMARPETVAVIGDRRAAIRRAVAEAGADDIVLVAGKGHEDWQVLAAGRIPFSDTDEVRAALEAWT